MELDSLDSIGIRISRAMPELTGNICYKRGGEERVKVKGKGRDKKEMESLISFLIPF